MSSNIFLKHFCTIFLVLFFSSFSYAETAHDFSFTSIDGEPLPLDQFKGKTLLVVNTASFCGYTKQYSGLQKLWENYKNQGLVVLGVPSNDFGGQEPGTESEIKDFCETNFNIDFPLTEKQKVKNEDAHPFYRWLASDSGAKSSPRWNFHKYLIDKNGMVIESFSSRVSPGNDKLISAIEKSLKE